MSRNSKELNARAKEISPAEIFKHGYKYEDRSIFEPTFWQRIQILFGHNILICANFYSMHKPGRVATGVIQLVVPHTEATIKKLLETDPNLLSLLPVDQKPKFGQVEQENAGKTTGQSLGS